jgi:hypothetical protein
LNSLCGAHRGPPFLLILAYTGFYICWMSLRASLSSVSSIMTDRMLVPLRRRSKVHGSWPNQGSGGTGVPPVCGMSEAGCLSHCSSRRARCGTTQEKPSRSQCTERAPALEPRSAGIRAPSTQTSLLRAQRIPRYSAIYCLSRSANPDLR